MSFAITCPALSKLIEGRSMAGKIKKKSGPQLGPESMIYEKQAQICKAFANPVRLRILDLIAAGECGISELQDSLNISKPNLSQHLAVLKSVGILGMRRDGRQIYCSLAIPEVKQACQLVRRVLIAQVQGASKMFVTRS
jgi:DNA-binding transcriptional ArsR family regulator